MKRGGAGMLALTLLGPSLVAAQPQVDAAAIERFLHTAQVVHREPIGKGVTRSERLVLSDGVSTRRAAWKVIDQRQIGLWRDGRGDVQLDFRDSWRNEVAAYELDKLLGLGLVPPVVRRTIDGRTGSLQLWVEDVMTEHARNERKLAPTEPRARLRWHHQMHRLRLLHQLTYNTDYLNGENVLVDEGFGLYAIDFSRAFRIQRELLERDDLVCFSRAVLARLEALERGDLEERMEGLLDGMQVAGLLARRDRILELARERIARNGQGPTLY